MAHFEHMHWHMHSPPHTHRQRSSQSVKKTISLHFATTVRPKQRTTSKTTTNLQHHHPVEHVHFQETSKGKMAQTKASESTRLATASSIFHQVCVCYEL